VFQLLQELPAVKPGIRIQGKQQALDAMLANRLSMWSMS